MNTDCLICGSAIEPKERLAISSLCKPCGERDAIQARTRWCVAPMHKSNYVLITDRDLLTGVNNKGGLVK